MSFIASMVAASAASAGLVTAGGIGAAALGAAATGAAGAGIGAGVSALTGGDIGEGALMGGIGGLGAGAGAALSGASMGAGAIGAEGAAATPFAAAAPVASTTAATAAPTAATAAPTATATAAPTTVANTTPVVASNTPTAVTGATNTSIGAGGGAGGGINTLPGQSGFVGPTATPDQIANASAYTDANMGTRLLADLTGQQGNIVGNTGLKMAGGALQSGVINAGINGLVAGAQGQDVGEAMGKGAATGVVGGAAGAGLASMAGSGGTLGSIGNFAAKHDVLVPAALSMGSGMALDSALTSDSTMPQQKGIRSLYKWDNNAYQPYRMMAAGGVTDLDNYDQTPQMQNPGTLDIPNRNEVTNNQGYMGDSVQLMAEGGISDLGSYSDGGRLLKGPGDGVSDDIPASIGGKQPARLAEGEFVVPARIVSELGNGSTDAGAKRLYQMMDRIQSDRKKTTGKGKFSDNPKAYKHLPA